MTTFRVHYEVGDYLYKMDVKAPNPNDVRKKFQDLVKRAHGEETTAILRKVKRVKAQA